VSKIDGFGPDPDFNDCLEDCGSCENCGCDLDQDDYPYDLCNQCQWWVDKADEE